MVPLAILLPRNFIIVAQTHIGQSWLLPSIPTHFSMTHDNVAGHLALRGDNTWEPLLQDSSPLFAAITADAPGRVTELLRARPEQVNSLLTLLYWGGDPNAAGAAARAQVSVKRRTPLMLAAQFGSTAVMEALLKQGATASTRVPEDDCTALQAAECFSDPKTAAAMMDMLREAERHLSMDAASPWALTGGQQDQHAGSMAHYGQHQGTPLAYSQHAFDGNSELSQPDYMSDEFRIFHFKITRCNKRFAHDWRSCPYAHPTENARRRDPREFRYCALACPDYKQGFCVRGDACGFAHGVFEVHLHPSRYRTQLCKDGPACHRPVCFFAHRLDELRTPTHTWIPGAEELAAAGVAMPPGTAVGGGGRGGGEGGFRAASLAHGAAHVAFSAVARNSCESASVTSADPRVIHRPTSSAGSTPSPPPPPPYRTSDEDRALSGGGSDREAAPVSAASSAAAAAAVMPYDDLLLSGPSSFLNGIGSIPAGLEVVGGPYIAAASPVVAPPSPLPPHPAAAAAAPVALSVEAAESRRQRQIGSASSGGTVSSASHDVCVLLQHLDGGGGGGGGYELLDPSSGMSAAAVGSCAAAAAAAQLPPVAGGAGAALLGFTAPRMSNAFARRHGLNPRDNPMINMQKLAIQAQAVATTTTTLMQHQPQPLQPRGRDTAAFQGGSSRYAPSSGRGNYPQQQPPLQYTMEQQQYLAQPYGGGGSGTWGTGQPGGGGALFDASSQIGQTGPMYGGASRQHHVTTAASIAALNSSLAVLDLQVRGGGYGREPDAGGMAGLGGGFGAIGGDGAGIGGAGYYPHRPAPYQYQQGRT